MTVRIIEVENSDECPYRGGIKDMDASCKHPDKKFQSMLCRRSASGFPTLCPLHIKSTPIKP